MSYSNYHKPNESMMVRGNVVYYGPVDRTKDIDYIMKKCEETNGTGLIIEDNTVYEIDCECYKQLQKRMEKKGNCVDPFQS